jgi:hypothetical protein
LKKKKEKKRRKLLGKVITGQKQTFLKKPLSTIFQLYRGGQFEIYHRLDMALHENSHFVSFVGQ